MHTPGSVHSLLFHPLPLELLADPSAMLCYRMSLMGPKQSPHLSAQQHLVYVIYTEMKDKQGNKTDNFC